MEKRIVAIVEKKDTIFPAEVRYARMFGTTGCSTFLVGFEKERLKKMDFDLSIQLESIQLYNCKFRYKWKEIDNTPKAYI